MRKLQVLCLGAMTALMTAVPAIAQEDALKDYPGYVDFGELSEIFGEPAVQISVGQSLLNLVGSLSASEDPEAAELFRKLNGVRVNVFETSEMADGAVALVQDISGKLGQRGWESVVTVNSADEQVRIFMKMSAESVEGITVMAVEETEAVFINVIGNIDPAELGRVMDNFDVDIDGATGKSDEG
jgi:hypothetical protein